MFKARNRLAVRNNKLVSNRVAGGSERALAAMSPELAATMEKADFTNSNMGLNSIQVSGIGTGTTRNLDLLLSGFLDERNEYSLRTLYRDIYYYDMVCGGAADMVSTLPFSDFSLVGLENKELNTFADSVDRLNLKTTFPDFSLGYLVDGVYLGTLVYEPRMKIFTDILQHDPQDCHFEDMPFNSQDPVIKVQQSEKLKTFLTSQDEVIAKQRRNYSRKLLDGLNSPEFTLDPLSTIYLPRRGLKGKFNSYFRRVLPWYLLEKMVLRGTLVEVSKRQRSALHVAAGSEVWEPTPEELQAIVSLFQQADFDPLGPIIATRNDVQTNEIRQGGDFLKITDIIDTTNQLKQRALGISEDFLSGSATYATAEAALSVFIENLKAYRDFLTQQVFYKKMFPLIAHVNDFKLTEKEQRQTANSTTQFKINDSTKYRMPQVRWHKSLQPHSDRDTIDMLNTLAEKGIPVTLRMWAAAGGLDMANLIQELDEDKKLRIEIAKKVGVQNPDQSGNEEFAKAVFGSLVRQNWLLRDYGELGESFTTDHSGKKKWSFNQTAAARRENEKIMRALVELKDPSRYKSTVARAQARLRVTQRR